MSTQGSIPPSIRDALESPSDYVLAVTGKPGTGKSLFVQEIFRKFEKSLLIASNAESTSYTKKQLSLLPEYERRFIVSQYWRNVVPQDLHQQPLKDQISKLLGQEVDFDADITIIDSWNDFVMPIDKGLRYEVQQSLIYAARNESKKILMVTEGDWQMDNPHLLYHSSDAIVNLERLRQDQRMYRQMSIEKMRSRAVGQDTFLFTLTRGRFSYVPWHIHKFPPITVEREPIPDAAPDRISTGNNSLDEILGGGFRRDSLNLIEVENLAAPYLETVYIPFISNHLQQGRPAVILLPEGWSPERFSHGLGHFVENKRVDGQVVFFGRHILGKQTNVRGIDDDPWKTLQEIRYEASQLEREFGASATVLYALDTLENKYGLSDLKGMMAEIAAALASTRRPTTAILSQQQALKSGSLAHGIHLRVQELCGVLSVCGVVPRTSFLALRPVLSEGFLDYDLIPIE